MPKVELRLTPSSEALDIRCNAVACAAVCMHNALFGYRDGWVGNKLTGQVCLSEDKQSNVCEQTDMPVSFTMTRTVCPQISNRVVGPVSTRCFVLEI